MLRDRIARAIANTHNSGQYETYRDSWLEEADAVLAELSGPAFDSMVEVGARAMLAEWITRGSALPDSALRWEFKADVRAALLAVLSTREDQTEGDER